MRCAAFLILTFCAQLSVSAEPTAIEFFEKNVRPVLAEHCYSCHGEKKQSSGLRLDRKADLLKGSDGGPVIVAGQPEKSPLILAIRQSGELKMPPKSKLSDAAIEALATWVKMGAPYPDNAKIVAADPSKTHWAFQPTRDPLPPTTKSRFLNAIDKFVAAKLEEKGQSLGSAADRRTLLRRVAHDLTGLLPTPEEVETFVADSSPQAFEKRVDRLLDSPQFGEQQARHWMDLARYADTKGYVFTEDRNYPFAFTYRDWLIRSFNQDLPYNQFIQYQLAADRLVKDDKPNLAAMGFLTVGRRFLNNQADIIDDRIDVTFRTFQGLTITCARCHDHKYDPIPTKDYYSLYGVFASSQEPKELPLIEQPKDTPEVKAFEAELKKREDVVKQAGEKLRNEYLTKLRSAAVISEYLRAARDARAKSRLIPTIADERKLNAVVLRQWDVYLDTKAKVEPLFAPFQSLAAIPDAEFAAKAPEALTKLIADKAYPAVLKVLTEKKPLTFADVCMIYGELIATPGEDKLLASVLGTGGPLDFNEQVFARVINRKERDDLNALKRKVDEWRAKSPAAPPRAMVMTEGSLTQPVVFVRGNPNNRGPQVPRQFPGLIAGPDRKPFADGSGRLEMAKAIADPKNPLTARVMANRIWGHLFGQGLVRTPSDFGVRCDPPTHPELLDWLSARFIESGWSVKKLHRLIVLSVTYQQSSTVRSEESGVKSKDHTTPHSSDDPENRLLGRMSRKRLTFEGLRDNLLKTAGRLDSTVGGRSVDLFKEPFTPRRAVYGFIDRQNLPGTFRSFDLALPDTHAPQRFTTTVPQQALFLMNSPFAIEQARALAARTEGDSAKRIEEMYRIVYGRKPTSEEASAALAFVNAPVEGVAKLSPWEQLAQVLLASNEFAFVD